MDVLEAGRVIGNYRVEALVATGGAGSVYRARDTRDERLVALKVLRLGNDGGSERVEQFLEEGRLLTALHHPSIVRILRTARQDGITYLAMEFIRGKDLGDVVDEHGPLNPRIALNVARQVASALDYAHKRGIYHRDVKPHNILLDEEGNAKVADFGIARSELFSAGARPPGFVVGTPAYMAPEQCRGAEPDARSDLYGLGATLYMILGGRPPFPSVNDPVVMERMVMEGPPIPLEALAPRLPPDVSGLVERLLAPDPGDRFQSGAEVVVAINEILATLFDVAREPTGAHQPRKRRPALRALATALLTALAGLGVLAVSSWLPVLLERYVENAPAHALEETRSTPSREELPSPSLPFPEVGARDGERDAAAEGDPGKDESSRRAASSLPGGRSLEPRRGSLDRLEARALRLRKALLDGNLWSALEHVEPSTREASGMTDRMVGLLRHVRGLPIVWEGDHRIERRAEGRVRVTYLFHQGEGAPPISVGLDWHLDDEGLWRVEPPLLEARSASDSERDKPRGESGES